MEINVELKKFTKLEESSFDSLKTYQQDEQDQSQKFELKNEQKSKINMTDQQREKLKQAINQNFQTQRVQNFYQSAEQSLDSLQESAYQDSQDCISHYKDQETFIVHDSIVTESPSRMVSRLDRMIENRAFNEQFNESFQQSSHSLERSFQTSEIEHHQIRPNEDALNGGKGTFIYKEKEDQSLYIDLIRRHQSHQITQRLQQHHYDKDVAVPSLADSLDNDEGVKVPQIRENKDNGGVFPYIRNKFHGITKMDQSEEIEQQKENVDNNFEQHQVINEKNNNREVRPPRAQGNKFVDQDQTTKVMNITQAMMSQREQGQTQANMKQQQQFQGFQTEQTRVLQISEQSSFHRLNKGRKLPQEMRCGRTGVNEDKDQHMLKLEYQAAPKTSLLKKLTIELLQTYQKIKKISRKSKLSGMNSSQSLEWLKQQFKKPDMIINSRYQIVKQIGQGVFGLVMQAKDLNEQGRIVAIKIVRDTSECKDQAKREIEMLKLINKIDHQKGFIVRYLDSFKYKKRNYCIVFEALEMNLCQLLAQRVEIDPTGEERQVGLCLEFMKIIGWQVLVGLSLMSMPNLNLIHCDLKPENIMLKEQGKTAIKIIDFGNACFSHNKIYKYVQSRYYRAPEIVMQLPYSTQIDMWSLGCIMYELHFGKVLFKSDQIYLDAKQDKTKSEDEQEAVSKLGQLFQIMISKQETAPKQMIETSTFSQQIQDWLNKTRIDTAPNFEHVLQQRTLEDPWFRQLYLYNHEEYGRFFNLISQLLHFNPMQRIRPTEALQHPFFTQEKMRVKDFTNFYNNFTRASVQKECLQKIENSVDSLSLGDESNPMRTQQKFTQTSNYTQLPVTPLSQVDQIQADMIISSMGVTGLNLLLNQVRQPHLISASELYKNTSSLGYTQNHDQSSQSEQENFELLSFVQEHCTQNDSLEADYLQMNQGLMKSKETNSMQYLGSHSSEQDQQKYQMLKKQTKEDQLQIQGQLVSKVTNQSPPLKQVTVNSEQQRMATQNNQRKIVDFFARTSTSNAQSKCKRAKKSEDESEDTEEDEDNQQDKDEEEELVSLDIANEVSTHHLNKATIQNYTKAKKTVPLNQMSFGGEKLEFSMRKDNQPFTYELNNLKQLQKGNQDMSVASLSNINYDQLFNCAQQMAKVQGLEGNCQISSYYQQHMPNCPLVKSYTVKLDRCLCLRQDEQFQQSSRFGGANGLNQQLRGFANQEFVDHPQQINSQYYQLLKDQLNQNAHHQKYVYFSEEESKRSESVMLQRNTDYSVHINKEKNNFVNFQLHPNNQLNQSSELITASRNGFIQNLDSCEDESVDLLGTKQSQAKQTQQMKDYFGTMSLNSNQQTQRFQSNQTSSQKHTITNMGERNLFGFTYQPPAPTQQTKAPQRNVFMQQVIDESSLEQASQFLNNLDSSNSGYILKQDTSMLSNMNPYQISSKQEGKRVSAVSSNNPLTTNTCFTLPSHPLPTQSNLATLQNLLNDASMLSNNYENKNFANNQNQISTHNNLNQQQQFLFQTKNFITGKNFPQSHCDRGQQQNYDQTISNFNPMSTPHQQENMGFFGLGGAYQSSYNTPHQQPQTQGRVTINSNQHLQQSNLQQTPLSSNVQRQPIPNYQAFLKLLDTEDTRKRQVDSRGCFITDQTDQSFLQPHSHSLANQQNQSTLKEGNEMSALKKLNLQFDHQGSPEMNILRQQRQEFPRGQGLDAIMAIGNLELYDGQGQSQNQIKIETNQAVLQQDDLFRTTSQNEQQSAMISELDASLSLLSQTQIEESFHDMKQESQSLQGNVKLEKKDKRNQQPQILFQLQTSTNLRSSQSEHHLSKNPTKADLEYQPSYPFYPQPHALTQLPQNPQQLRSNDQSSALNSPPSLSPTSPQELKSQYVLNPQRDQPNSDLDDPDQINPLLLLSTQQSRDNLHKAKSKLMPENMHSKTLNQFIQIQEAKQCFTNQGNQGFFYGQIINDKGNLHFKLEEMQIVALGEEQISLDSLADSSN